MAADSLHPRVGGFKFFLVICYFKVDCLVELGDDGIETVSFIRLLVDEIEFIKNLNFIIGFHHTAIRAVGKEPVLVQRVAKTCKAERPVEFCVFIVTAEDEVIYLPIFSCGPETHRAVEEAVSSEIKGSKYTLPPRKEFNINSSTPAVDFRTAKDSHV